MTIAAWRVDAWATPDQAIIATIKERMTVFAVSEMNFDTHTEATTTLPTALPLDFVTAFRPPKARERLNGESIGGRVTNPFMVTVTFINSFAFERSAPGRSYARGVIPVAAPRYLHPATYTLTFCAVHLHFVHRKIIH